MPKPMPPHHRLPTPGAEADEREFEAFAQAQDPLDIDAATWVLRRRSGLDDSEEAQWQAWLDADPRHAAAFDDMEATLGDVQRLPDGEVQALRAGLPGGPSPSAPLPRAAPPDPPHRALGSGLRLWLAGWGHLFPQAAAAALALAAVCGGWMGWTHWQQQPTFAQTFATQQGQQLTAHLPDAGSQGSTLQLDTGTQVQARLYRDRREVRLESGQAMFTVAPDAKRPFHVVAGALRITVVGTRFSVRHTLSGLDAGQTVVSVEEGQVRVARTDPAAGDGRAVSAVAEPAMPAIHLTAGQRVVADGAGRISPVSRVPSASIAPWRDGRISFDQTPLGQAIAEFERYGRTRLVVRDPAVAAMPVGGSYSLGQWQRFADTLLLVLPVRLVRRGDAMEVVAR